MTCVDCGVVIEGTVRQRRRCPDCKRRRATSTHPPIRALRAGEAIPTGAPRRYVAGHGYVRLRWRVGDEFVEAYEHRVVSDAGPGEEVHHINGDRSDNRPENLMVLTGEEHDRVHAGDGLIEAHNGGTLRFDVEEAIRLYASEGLSTAAIARRFGVVPSTVFRTLRRRGVQMRSEKRIAIPKRELRS